MSEIMLLGILKMSPELWNDDCPIDIIQRHSKYLEAAQIIQKYIKQRDNILNYLNKMDNWLRQEKNLYNSSHNEIHSIINYIRKEIT